ncbi:hypothetical protein L1987_15946 [Smallanthus sonchifolius]|uniref:Uncharacterized protein n=1 Tax=Smallanthus sonchifolius TaxID=185202 RepID=A0ACB9J8I4_9ASTR|nr:hypothetical protein L1987_15946 [Smallanthus sonchifolius]
MVIDQDDGYDAEEEEYLDICNEYKENGEHDFMISDSGNHLILPAVSQVWMNQYTPPEDDDKHNKQQAVVDINEEDDDSSEAIETDHEEGQTVNDHVAEEFAQETVNLQMVIVKDKTNVLKGNEEFEIDNEEMVLKKNTMETDEVVKWELKIQKLEDEVNRLKEVVETKKVTADALVKEKMYLISERDMAMQRIEELESMLKQLKLERENEKNTEEMNNEGLETNSNEKAGENHIEDWEFQYKTAHFCIRRKDGSISYLDHIKEVLNLPLQDIKRMIKLREDGKSNSNKENYLITWNEEEVQGKVFGKMSFEPPTFKLISQLTPEGYKEVEPIQNETEGESGEVDITKLIKENKILDAKSEKTLVGSRIGASNVQSPSTITDVKNVEFDVGNKHREERNRKLSEMFCSPYVDREVSMAEKITRLEGNI